MHESMPLFARSLKVKNDLLNGESSVSHNNSNAKFHKQNEGK